VGVATLYSLADYFHLLVNPCDQTDQSGNLVNPLITPQSFGYGSLRYEISLSSWLASRHPRYPRPESDPCHPHPPSRLGRISRYPLDVAHRFESVFEIEVRAGWRGEGMLETGFRNRTKSSYLRDSWRWCIRDISWRIQEKKKKLVPSYRNYGLCGISSAERQISKATRRKLWREMFRTPNVATMSLTRRRLGGDFRNAFRKRGLSPMRASRTCGETEWWNTIMNLMRLNAVKENMSELSLARRWHLLMQQTVLNLCNWQVLCFYVQLTYILIYLKLIYFIYDTLNAYKNTTRL